VVVIGTEVRSLSSSSSGTRPEATGGSNDALVERAPRRGNRPARTNSGWDRESIWARRGCDVGTRRNRRACEWNPRPI